MASSINSGCVFNVIAIDPGIKNTGIAYQSAEGVFGYRTVVTLTAQTVAERIQKILGAVDQIADPAVWKTVIIEDFVGHLGKDTVYLIGAFLGFFTGATSIIKVHPKKWVKEFFGTKKDYKKAAAKWCRKNRLTVSSQHEADALCLLAWGTKNKNPLGVPIEN